MPDSWNIGTMKNILHDADGRLKSLFLFCISHWTMRHSLSDPNTWQVRSIPMCIILRGVSSNE